MSKLDALRAVLDQSDPLFSAEDVFEDVEAMPLDEVFEDGDDSIHGEHRTLALAAEPTTMVLKSALYVPLKRTMKKGMRGKDVLALQRAVAKAGFRKWGVGFTGIFGPGLEEDVRQLQRRHGLRATGVYDAATHAVGKRYFDRYGAYLMTQFKPPITTSDTRARIVAAAMFGYSYRGSIHYTQGPLRMYGVRNKIRIPKIPYYEDCSSFATWCYWHAGARDPNGLGFNGYGYTGTMANHGVRVSSPRPGDLVLYGYGWPYSHVTIYIGNGRCISHGNERGPSLLAYNYRMPAQIRSYVA